jgi:dTDP-4-amino-4,6-dideoxygalactose transaminase
LHKFYKKKGFRQGLFPNAEQYYKQAFSLPLHPNLQLEDIDTICNIVIDCLSIV